MTALTRVDGQALDTPQVGRYLVVLLSRLRLFLSPKILLYKPDSRIAPLSESCPQITPPQKRGRVTLMTAKTINQRGRDTRPIQIQYPLL